MKHIFRTFAAAALLSVATPVLALTAQQTVQKEVVVNKADGTQEIRYEAAELVTPGERIVYTLNFLNDDVEDAKDLVLTMPIPAEVIYMEGSAQGDTSVVTYSADGGQTFTSRDTVMVAGLDGVLKVADSKDITHIRWNVAGPIAPGATGALVYKGVLK